MDDNPAAAGHPRTDAVSLLRASCQGSRLRSMSMPETRYARS